MIIAIITIKNIIIRFLANQEHHLHLAYQVYQLYQALPVYLVSQVNQRYQDNLEQHQYHLHLQVHQFLVLYLVKHRKSIIAEHIRVSVVTTCIQIGHTHCIINLDTRQANIIIIIFLDNLEHHLLLAYQLFQVYQVHQVHRACKVFLVNQQYQDNREQHQYHHHLPARQFQVLNLVNHRNNITVEHILGNEVNTNIQIVHIHYITNQDIIDDHIVIIQLFRREYQQFPEHHLYQLLKIQINTINIIIIQVYQEHHLYPEHRRYQQYQVQLVHQEYQLFQVYQVHQIYLVNDLRHPVLPVQVYLVQYLDNHHENIHGYLAIIDIQIVNILYTQNDITTDQANQVSLVNPSINITNQAHHRQVRKINHRFLAYPNQVYQQNMHQINQQNLNQVQHHHMVEQFQFDQVIQVFSIIEENIIINLIIIGILMCQEKYQKHITQLKL